MPHSLTKLTLPHPPSCAQFFRPEFGDRAILGDNRELLVVGTYFLEKNEDQGQQQNEGQHKNEDEAKNEEDSRNEDGGNGERKEQSRSGSLVLFELSSTPEPSLSTLQTVPLPSAILDIRFHPLHPRVLAACTSTGTVFIFALAPGAHMLVEIGEVRVCDGLVLQVQWMRKFSGGYKGDNDDDDDDDERVLALTSSKGTAHVVTLTPGMDAIEAEREIDAVKGDYEMWSVAFWESSEGGERRRMMAVGDDGARLALTPLDSSQGALDSSDVRVFKKLHSAGITALLPLSHGGSPPLLLLTGSYDETLNLVSFPAHSPPTVLASIALGGGVWRLDLISTDERRVRVLASCMHAGARVVEFLKNEKEWAVKILARFEDHESMNYGSDFVVLRLTEGEASVVRVVSTSFYDRLVCVWDVEESV